MHKNVKKVQKNDAKVKVWGFVYVKQKVEVKKVPKKNLRVSISIHIYISCALYFFSIITSLFIPIFTFFQLINLLIIIINCCCYGMILLLHGTP